MYYVYVLKSEKDGRFYVGYSANSKVRIMQYQKGEVTSTRHRLPVAIIYYEAYLNQDDAKGREKFLKSGSGHRFLAKQLRYYLALK